MDVADWLRQLGLERYEAAFRENDVSAAIFPDLTSEDLKELGIVSVGHRRQLLEAIAKLHPDSKTVDDMDAGSGTIKRPELAETGTAALECAPSASRRSFIGIANGGLLGTWEAREHCCCQAGSSFAGQHDPTM